MPPRVYRWALIGMACLAPRSVRPECLKRWLANLTNWWILAERGEFPASMGDGVWGQVRIAFREALRLRLGCFSFGGWMRHPVCPLIAGPVALLSACLTTHGLRCTRVLIALALHPGRPIAYARDAAWNGSPADLLFAHGFLLVFAFIVGISMILLTHPRWERRGWRYGAFLAGKIAWIVAVVPVVWIEGGAVLRTRLAHHARATGFACLTVQLLFLVGFSALLAWSFADQRRRCRVCLRRLTLPVAMGSWASVLEPVTTELVCEKGHGALSLGEIDAAPGDRWIALDASWEKLFERDRV